MESCIISSISLCSLSQQILTSPHGGVYIITLVCTWKTTLPQPLVLVWIHILLPWNHILILPALLFAWSYLYLPGSHSILYTVSFENFQYIVLSLKTFLEVLSFGRLTGKMHFLETIINGISITQGHRLTLLITESVQSVFLLWNNEWSKRKVDDLIRESSHSKP